MAYQAEIDAMWRAIELAASVDLADDANPRVGAVVIASDGRPISEGLHRGAGSDHAEIAALNLAGSQANGATVVVTLEPCNHHGVTGPCSQALIDAGVRRVVFAHRDPNQRASGGAECLRAAGIEVEVGLLEAEASALNAAWTARVSAPKPFVTWKFASTLDGRSAASDGTSRWITGEEARADVHRLRSHHDTILVGTHTVQRDNPRLTVRSPDSTPAPRAEQPLRAVMGLRELDADLLVFNDDADTVVLRTREPSDALARLAAMGRSRIWLEGGPALAASFVRAGLVDEVIGYLAPAMLGAGRPAVAELGIETIADAVRFELADVTRVGSDVRLTMKGHR